MFRAFEFCIPTRGTKVPHTPDWIHEIKFDGYRLRVERAGGPSSGGPKLGPSLTFSKVSKIDQYFGGRAWKLFPITAHHGIYR